jgi:hypothetical protein
MKRICVLFMILGLVSCSEAPKTNTPAAQPTMSRPADDAGAVQNLREINTAQANYQHRTRRFALSFEELVEAHLLNQDPSKSVSGYEISLHPSADAESYTLTATPTMAGANARYFFSDKSGVIRVEQGKDANAASSPIS